MLLELEYKDRKDRQLLYKPITSEALYTAMDAFVQVSLEKGGVGLYFLVFSNLTPSRAFPFTLLSLILYIYSVIASTSSLGGIFCYSGIPTALIL